MNTVINIGITLQACTCMLACTMLQIAIRTSVMITYPGIMEGIIRLFFFFYQKGQMTGSKFQRGGGGLGGWRGERGERDPEKF